MDHKAVLAFALLAALSCANASLARAEITSINPSKDNTLYEYGPVDGDLSNGAGFHFFAGATATDLIRRGVLAFDIAGNIPPGASITAVSLSLNISKTPSNTPRVVELHIRHA